MDLRGICSSIQPGQKIMSRNIIFVFLLVFTVICILTLFLPAPYKQAAIAIEFVLGSCGLVAVLIATTIQLRTKKNS
jgi:hypothetical protein